VARGFSGEPEHLKALMVEAIKHNGFTLVDILQPCVSFNKVNTFSWYKQRVYHLGDDYDAQDRSAAFMKALEWGERIPLGIIYRNNRPLYEDRIPVLKDGPLTGQVFDPKKAEQMIIFS